MHRRVPVVFAAGVLHDLVHDVHCVAGQHLKGFVSVVRQSMQQMLQRLLAYHSMDFLFARVFLRCCASEPASDSAHRSVGHDVKHNAEYYAREGS